MSGALVRTATPLPPVEDAPELMVDGEYLSPPPLDRRIASVWLRTMTNNPTKGYEASVSAAFGKERVTLKAGEFELETQFSLTTADIELSFIRCEATLLRSSGSGEADGWTTTRTEDASYDIQRKVGGNLSLEGAAGTERLQAKAGIGGMVGGETSTTRAVSVHQQQVHGDWNLIGPNAIRVGRSGKILDGTVITDFTGWRVTPRRTDETSTVLARILVREDWIKFENVEYIRAPPPWRRRMSELFQLKGEKRKRKEAFILLLRHLAQTELRQHQREREAVIAVDAINVKPGSEHGATIISEQRRGEICIPSQPLEEFLQSEEGHEESTLVALGVRADLIPPSAKSSRGGTFVPGSSPVLAVELLRKIHSQHPMPTTDVNVISRLPNELRDLRAMKLVTYRNGEARLNSNPDIDPEITLRRTVSEAPIIKIARGVLRINPNATSREIADAAALELGKPWTKPGTKQRNGGAIRRWTVWLEPHLIDPNSSGEAAALVSYATDRRVTKGRPATLTPAVEAIVRQMFEDDESVSAIAERFKVTHNAVRKWKKKLGYDVAEAKQD